MHLSKIETQKRSERKGTKTQLCFVSAQLHDVSLFQNLKKLITIFAHQNVILENLEK